MELDWGHVRVWLSSKHLTTHQELITGQPSWQLNATFTVSGWKSGFEIQSLGKVWRNHDYTPRCFALLHPPHSSVLVCSPVTECLPIGKSSNLEHPHGYRGRGKQKRSSRGRRKKKGNTSLLCKWSEGLDCAGNSQLLLSLDTSHSPSGHLGSLLCLALIISTKQGCLLVVVGCVFFLKFPINFVLP